MRPDGTRIVRRVVVRNSGVPMGRKLCGASLSQFMRPSIHASRWDADSCGASLSQFMRPYGTRIRAARRCLNSCVPTGRGFVRRVVVSIHASLRDADSCGASLSQFMRPDGTRGACCAPLSLNSCVLNSCVPTGRGFVRRVVVSIHASLRDADSCGASLSQFMRPDGTRIVRRVVVSIRASRWDADSCGASSSQFMRPYGTQAVRCVP